MLYFDMVRMPDFDKDFVVLFINEKFIRNIPLLTFKKIEARWCDLHCRTFYYRIIDLVSQVDFFLELQAYGVPNYAVLELVIDENFFYQASITYMNF